MSLIIPTHTKKEGIVCPKMDENINRKLNKQVWFLFKNSDQNNLKKKHNFASKIETLTNKILGVVRFLLSLLCKTKGLINFLE